MPYASRLLSTFAKLKESTMSITKLTRFVVAVILAGMFCAGCSMGPKNSDQANGSWSAKKAGMNHDQFMAMFRQKMGQHQLGAAKTNVPEGAIKAGVRAPQSSQAPTQ